MEVNKEVKRCAQDNTYSFVPFNSPFNSLFNSPFNSIILLLSLNMKKPLILITAIALAWGLQAQRHYDDVLAQVEQASPLLLAARQQSEAARLQARTGYLLPNPEVEMATYKGFPAEAGNRIDLQVSQTFELPSVLVRRSRLRRLAEQAATLDYLTLRNTLLREVQSACADLVYYQQVHTLYARRHAQTERLVNA